MNLLDIIFVNLTPTYAGKFENLEDIEEALIYTFHKADINHATLSFLKS